MPGVNFINSKAHTLRGAGANRGERPDASLALAGHPPQSPQGESAIPPIRRIGLMGRELLRKRTGAPVTRGAIPRPVSERGHHANKLFDSTARTRDGLCPLPARQVGVRACPLPVSTNPLRRISRDLLAVARLSEASGRHPAPSTLPQPSLAENPRPANPFLHPFPSRKRMDRSGHIQNPEVIRASPLRWDSSYARFCGLRKFCVWPIGTANQINGLSRENSRPVANPWKGLKIPRVSGGGLG
jgi:hypothetical protein